MIEAKKGYFKDKKLSPSQLQTWLDSEKDYIKYYIKGEPRPTNKYMQFGSMVHKALEENRSENETLNFLIGIIPRLEAPEVKLEIPTKIKKVEVILNGIIDTYGEKEGVIIDYKTSKAGKWNAEIVAKKIQFKFYTYLHYLKTKKILEKVDIVNLITEEDEDGAIYLTGDFDVFTYIPSKADIDEVKNKILEFVEWGNNLKEEVLNHEVSQEIKDTLSQMAHLSKEIDQLEYEKTNLKARVEAYMEMFSLNNIKTDMANIFYTTRKTYNYPETIVLKDKELKKMQDDLKKEKSEFEETAEPATITKSLTFKPYADKE